MKIVDADILRVARKLSAIENVEPASVIVPTAVASTFRDLENAFALSKRVLHGDRPAGEQLIAKIGGRTPLPPISRPKSRALSSQETVLLMQAHRGPLDRPACPDSTRSNMVILQAAFQLDAAYGYLDARLTARAVNYIRTHRDVISNFEHRIDCWSTSRSNLGMRSEADGLLIGPKLTPLFAPGTELHCERGLMAPGPIPDDSVCRELADLCVQLFGEFAAAALAEDDAQLIAHVEPNCLSAKVLDDNSIFTTKSDPSRPFPPQRGDYRLIFRGQDISDRIRDWSEDTIHFTIPGDSKTGYVWLNRFANSLSSGLSAALSNLCGVRLMGENYTMPPSPRALIAVVHEPLIDSFRVDGKADHNLVTEALSVVQLDWSVRLADQIIDQPLPPRSSIEITIRDGDGNLLHQSSEPIGTWSHRPEKDTTYQFSAASWAGETCCGEAGPRLINLHCEKRLYVEPDEPKAAIVAGRTGTLRIRMSCPAAEEGAFVRLTSNDPTILRLPDIVGVFPRQTSAIFQFSTARPKSGVVQITAQLADHRDGVLEFEVVQNITAIALSGGGAKGSFEVGALLFLREVWSYIQPRIVCGTSVGAINAVAVAESNDGVGIDTVEAIWLGLQYPSDMYRLSPEFEKVFNDLGIDIADVALHGGGLPFDSVTGFLGYLGTLGLSADTAAWVASGWALAGPVGGLIAGLVQLGSSDTSKLNDAIQSIGNASYAYDLAPIQALIEKNVDIEKIANSGIKLRLVAVALEDGGLYYVTESGHLLRERAANASFDEPITNHQVPPLPVGPVDPGAVVFPGLVRNPLVAGVMASAAFPGIFQIRPIFTNTTFQYYMDGGTRQVLPTQAAFELGAQLIFSVAASPMGTGRFTRNPIGYPATLLPIVRRAVDLQGSELEMAIEAPRDGFCGQVERILIHPTFEVHDTTEVDPGLIRINIAYGYFQAFLVDRLRRGNINYLQYSLWRLIADDLIATRLMCYQIESGAKLTSPAAGELSGQVVNIQNGPAFSHEAAQLLRNLKNQIAELIVQLFEQFGVAAFPHTLRSSVMGDQSVLDWAATWEIHPDPLRSYLASFNLWTPLEVDPGSPGDVDQGLPPIPPTYEVDVVEQFPIPDPIRRVLEGTAQHVFGRNVDNELMHYYWSPLLSWAAENLTRDIGEDYQFASDPEVINLQDVDVPTQHVFGRNKNGELIHYYYWSPQPSWAAENLTRRDNIGGDYQFESSPAAINLQSGDVPTQHVFARNENGELIHYYWSPEPSWAAENLTQRDSIKDKGYQIAGDPQVINLQSGDIPTQHVFARNENGELIHYYWSPEPSWAAENLTQRDGIRDEDYHIVSDPKVINLQVGDVPEQHVFARNDNGELIHYFWSPEPSWAAENLTQRGNIGGVYRFASDPQVISLQSGDIPMLHVFARNENGELIHYFWWLGQDPSWAAENLTQRGGIRDKGCQIASDPKVINLQIGEIPTQHVFARNKDGELIHYYWSPEPSWAAENLTQRGNIGEAYRLFSDPEVINLVR